MSPVHISVTISYRYNGKYLLQKCEQIINKLKEKNFKKVLTNR